jgi:hypothetical protein
MRTGTHTDGLPTPKALPLSSQTGYCQVLTQRAEISTQAPAPLHPEE